MFVELAKEGEETETLMIDATYLKSAPRSGHRTAASLRLKNSQRPPDRVAVRSDDQRWTEHQAARCH